MQDSMRFDVSLYQEEGAQTMAREWVRRMLFFYTAWRDAGERTPWQFPPAVPAAYVESDGFQALAVAMTGNPKAASGVQKVRAIQPSGPGT